MRVRLEAIFFLKVLRVAISTPINLITCAIIIEVFVIFVTAPKPSTGYFDNNPVAVLLTLATTIFALLFGLYLLIRTAVVFFCKWREALFFGCALWALSMPTVIAIFTSQSFGYRDEDVKHALVAMMYNVEMKRVPSTFKHPPKLIDLGDSCYRDYSGHHCWIVIVKPQSQDDQDIAQDLGTWHSIKSNTLLLVVPRAAEYGEVGVRRIGDGAYSVLGQDYAGWLGGALGTRGALRRTQQTFFSERLRKP